MDASTIVMWGLSGGALGAAAYAAAQARQARREIESRYRRTEAWLSIYSVLQPRLPLPATGPWIASPELLHELVRLIFEQRPRRIVELGSGLSTVVCAYALEKIGQGGRILSLDHDARFAEETRRRLRLHGLDAIASVLDAPLRETTTDVGTQPWYTVPQHPELADVDLLVVDGPPGGGRRLARFPALPLLRDRLAPDATVVVDDAARPGEQQIVARWCQSFPEFTSQYRATEKGTAILRRASRPAGA